MANGFAIKRFSGSLLDAFAILLRDQHGGNYAAYVRDASHSASGRSMPTLKQIQRVLRRLQAELEQRILEIEASQTEEVPLISEDLRLEIGHKNGSGTSLSQIRNQQAQVQAMIFRLQRIASVRVYRGQIALDKIKNANPLVSFTNDLDEVIKYAAKPDQFLTMEDSQAVGVLKEAARTGDMSALTASDHTATILH